MSAEAKRKSGGNVKRYSATLYRLLITLTSTRRQDICVLWNDEEVFLTWKWREQRITLKLFSVYSLLILGDKEGQNVCEPIGAVPPRVLVHFTFACERSSCQDKGPQEGAVWSHTDTQYERIIRSDFVLILKLSSDGFTLKIIKQTIVSI
jgi:hypothetical protein